MRFKLNLFFAQSHIYFLSYISFLCCYETGTPRLFTPYYLHSGESYAKFFLSKRTTLFYHLLGQISISELCDFLCFCRLFRICHRNSRFAGLPPPEPMRRNARTKCPGGRHVNRAREARENHLITPVAFTSPCGVIYLSCRLYPLVKVLNAPP